MAGPLVETLGGDTVDNRRHGGKAAALGRLMALGHNVPAGFVITTDAIAVTLDELGLLEDTSRLAASLRTGQPDPTAAGRIHDRLQTGPLPASLTQDIRAASASLADGPLIVRSSATVEDSASHSFAGIFESIRVDDTDELEAALRTVWCSVYSARALDYASVTDVDEVPMMAVVVQRFIDADRSGVMFTTFGDPQGNPATLIEHVAGTAEKLVLGEVTPDRLWLGASGEPSLTEESRLSASTMHELHTLAGTLEEQFGGPQDVEWCVLADELFVVQTRPITVGAGTGTSSITDVEPVLRGTAASGGVGVGAAHVAFNIEQALALQPGDVLVTTMTNPDMVVAMRNSAAIVTDVGGMICHAAIVSRELQLPCVVGTGEATSSLAAGQLITVDGYAGAVFDGSVAVTTETSDSAGAPELWAAWQSHPDTADAVPLLHSGRALSEAPPTLARIGFLVDHEVRSDARGVWADGDLASRIREVLEALEATERAIEVHSEDPTLAPILAALLVGADDASLRMAARDPASAPAPGVVAPLAAAAAAGSAARDALPTVEQAIGRGMDPSAGPGPPPHIRMGAMPAAAHRTRWWRVLPEYGRYHREFDTAADSGEYPWIEIRPEIIITPLLKSLVQPAFEMVPRVMGFPSAPPMHTKWFRGRFCVRADTFAQTWAALVNATWDPAFMPEFLERVRRSYDQLGSVVELFPAESDEFAALTVPQIVALMTSWWPRWVEFFALTLFIQAQGEAILFPVIEETVTANLADAASPSSGNAWPSVADLVAPTTPVMSGEYMASLELVRAELDAAGLTTVDDAIAAMEHASGLGATIRRHIEAWHWMRDRDLVFEPWDTPQQVIATALRTDPHPPVDYAANLERNRLALEFHAGMARAAGRAAALHHGVRFLQDLNVERENHHILWLRYSYPLRQLIVEAERRLVAAGGLETGDVFFLQAPELMDLLGALPDPVPATMRERADARRVAFRHETKLEPAADADVMPEDDYF